MRKMIVFLIVVLMVSSIPIRCQEKKAPAPATMEDEAPHNRLAVLWTSGDPEVAKKMVFLYVYNAKKNNWFKTIRFIIWGASTKLLSEDKELQKGIKKMKNIGIELYACKWCSDSYGVSDLLTKLGVNVIYYGKPLTKLIKEDWKILTF